MRTASDHLLLTIGAWAAVAIVAALAAFSGIGSSLPLDAHEIYVARTSEEMMSRGEWLVPYFNDSLRLKKPPLNYWLTIAAGRVIDEDGKVSEFAARLPSAIGGVSLSLLTLAIALVLFDRRTALLAGLLMASSGGYLAYTHSARPEMVYAALCTAGILGFCAAERWHGQPAREGRSRLAAWFGWSAFGLAVLAKGPQLPLITVVGWYVGAAASKDLRFALRATRVWSGVTIALLLSSWWFIFIWLRVPEAKQIWRVETLDRYGAGSRAWWKILDPYYLYRTGGLVLPWVVAYPLALLTPWNKAIENRRGAMRLWWLVVLGMLFLSFSFGRRWYYMLPLLAPIIVLMSAAVVQLAQELAARSAERKWIATLVLHVIVVAAVLVGMLLGRSDRPGAIAAAVVIATLGCVALAMVVLPASRIRLGNVGMAAAVSCFAALAFAAAQQTGALHSDSRFERADFARRVGASVAPADDLLGWYDDWAEEQFTLHRSIRQVRKAAGLGTLPAGTKQAWMLVDATDPEPELPSHANRKIVIQQDYDGVKNRLQLWHLDLAAR